MRSQVGIPPHSRQMNCTFINSSGATGPPLGPATKIVFLHAFTPLNFTAATQQKG